VKAAGLTGQGRLPLHSLRHGFASLLIAQRLNVVFVSRQLGHASPVTTLETSAHLCPQADHCGGGAGGGGGELGGDEPEMRGLGTT
jgi:hypothetical protein